MTTPWRPLERMALGLGLEPDEGGRLLLMGTLVGVLYCAYTIAKVLRDALFLQEFGALALPYAYVAVALGTAATVWLEARWSRGSSRNRATRVSQYLAIACSIAAAIALPHARHRTTALFYVWTGSQAMMLLPHFWGLALELWDSRRARRVFPVLAGCGLLGGLAGGAFASWSAPLLERVGLMWTLPPLLIAARELTRRLEVHRPHRTRPRELSASPWTIMRRSPYIGMLVAALAFSVIVGTLVDFQFKYVIQHRFTDPHELTRFLGLFYVGLNALSLLFQFGMAGWLLQRLGLGVSTGLQPLAVLALATSAVMAPGLWIVVSMRWVQGVLSATLGKSSSEIYYTAIRPAQRRRIKPAIDALVERWSDAAVGVLLVVALHILHVRVSTIAVATAALSAVWIAVLFALDRRYGLAFHEVLASRWIEPDDTSGAVRVPAARRALLEALQAADENGIVVALQLSGQVHDARIVQGVKGCLTHASPAVRAAAVAAMESLRVPDRESRIPAFLADPHPPLRRAAVSYLVVRGPRPVEFTLGLLEGPDAGLREEVIEVLFDHACEARAALSLDWIDRRLASPGRRDHVLAARALGILSGAEVARRLPPLIADPDPEVRRAALHTAIRRPSRQLLDALLALFLVPGPHVESSAAVAAIGDPAVGRLERLLAGEAGPAAQSLAADTLAQISTPPALRPLAKLARSPDIRLRHLALRGLARARVRTGQPVLSRSNAHRFFLRELREYRACLDPALAFESHAAAEVRLLAASWLESAGMALERAVQALACWYESDPLIGVLERLRSRDRAIAAPALEFLEHVLPRATFAPVRKIFEESTPVTAAGKPGDAMSAWIDLAWSSPDSWLRACAVRASRNLPGYDHARFVSSSSDDERVREEIAALPLPGTVIPDALLREVPC